MTKDKSNKLSASNQNYNQITPINQSKSNINIDNKNINNLNLNIPKLNANSKTNLNLNLKPKSSNPKDDLLRLKENISKNHDE